MHLQPNPSPSPPPLRLLCFLSPPFQSICITSTTKHCRWPPSCAPSLTISYALWRLLSPSPALSYWCSAVDGLQRRFAAALTTVSTISSFFFRTITRTHARLKRDSLLSNVHFLGAKSDTCSVSPRPRSGVLSATSSLKPRRATTTSLLR